MQKINITILGSTGSIGTQTLEVISKHLDKFQVVKLTCHKNKKLLKEQEEKFKRPVGSHPSSEPSSSHSLIVNAISGSAGLEPTIKALKQGKVIALANKESVVLDGKNLKNLERKYAKKGAKILPLDSEHHAVLRLLQTQNLEEFDAKKVEKIIITCSGGPFFGYTKAQLKGTLEDETLRKKAFTNPNWKMGKKILLESAFLINKGYELIEACHLFDVPLKNLDAIIDRKSYIHAIVEFKNGKSLVPANENVIALAYKPDMKTVIEDTLLSHWHAINAKPSDKPFKNKKLKFLTGAELKKYKFNKIDHKTFPAVKNILKAHKQGKIKILYAKYDKFLANLLKSN